MDSDIKSRRRYIGLKQSTEAIEAGQVLKAYVARDADRRVREPFEDLCQKKNVPVIYYDTKQQLGRACGIDVGATCVVVLI
ncbi:MAG: ribosomal L7Ae/L30e/S12e/Gadd45 family protein [Clostridia bacterium]|nr:ribosomal L7Ae/L30e/S12e/Gadd45 family protein [Clostridia bacterium]